MEAPKFGEVAVGDVFLTDTGNGGGRFLRVITEVSDTPELFYVKCCVIHMDGSGQFYGMSASVFFNGDLVAGWPTYKLSLPEGVQLSGISSMQAPEPIPVGFDEYKITGYDAIEYAEVNGRTLNKYSDPIEDAREGLTVDEARKVASEDPTLIWIEAGR